MRAVVQRVSSARVDVDEETVASIGRGLLVLVGVAVDDTEADVEWMAEKLAHLRLFEDDAGKMNLSVTEIGGAVLVVSQFTLLGDCRKGRRPSFGRAAPPEPAALLCRRLVEGLRARSLPVETGRFGARMRVASVNEGPVTLLVDSKKAF